jgi:hypothetical protein
MVPRVDTVLVLSTLVVLGDIGHVSKQFDLHQEWTLRITQEFYRQGDRERARGMPISPLCDRATGNVAKSQIGFYQYLILPLYRYVGGGGRRAVWVQGVGVGCRGWVQGVGVAWCCRCCESCCWGGEGA